MDINLTREWTKIPFEVGTYLLCNKGVDGTELCVSDVDSAPLSTVGGLEYANREKDVIDIVGGKFYFVRNLYEDGKLTYFKIA